MTRWMAVSSERLAGRIAADHRKLYIRVWNSLVTTSSFRQLFTLFYSRRLGALLHAYFPGLRSSPYGRYFGQSTESRGFTSEVQPRKVELGRSHEEKE